MNHLWRLYWWLMEQILIWKYFFFFFFLKILSKNHKLIHSRDSNLELIEDKKRSIVGSRIYEIKNNSIGMENYIFQAQGNYRKLKVHMFRIRKADLNSTLDMQKDKSNENKNAHVKRIPCLNTNLFPSNAINVPQKGASFEINSCQKEGTYTNITGVKYGMVLSFFINYEDELTVRSGAYNGPVIASGGTPLTFTSSYTGDIFVHWNSFDCGIL